jgi:hypothetical protein
MPPPGAEGAGADVGLAERRWVVIPRDAGSHLTPGGGPSNQVTHNSPLGDGNRPSERVSWHPPIRPPRPGNGLDPHAGQPALARPGTQRCRPDALACLGMAFAVMLSSPNAPAVHASCEDDRSSARPRPKLSRARPGTGRGPAVICYSEPAGEPATTPPRRNANSGAADSSHAHRGRSTISAGRRAIIYQASRGLAPSLWSDARAAVRMFIHRRSRCERPHLPLSGWVAVLSFTALAVEVSARSRPGPGSRRR